MLSLVSDLGQCAASYKKQERDIKFNSKKTALNIQNCFYNKVSS